MISLIVARDRNGAIGKDNSIPWRAPEDLAFFQRETLGGAIIMGRNTWDSLPVKPLKQRLNIVVTSRPLEADPCFGSVGEAVKHAYDMGFRRVYGVGGAAIYAEMLPLADRLVVTEVDVSVDAPDTMFPTFSEADWRKVGAHLLRPQSPRCTVTEWLRRH